MFKCCSFRPLFFTHLQSKRNLNDLVDAEYNLGLKNDVEKILPVSPDISSNPVYHQIIINAILKHCIKEIFIESIFKFSGGIFSFVFVLIYSRDHWTSVSTTFFGSFQFHQFS